MKTVFVLMLIWVLPGLLLAQSDSLIYHVETNDGNEFMGVVIEQTQAQIILKTEKFGVITLQRTDIKSMEEVKVEKIIQGKYWFDNPQASRYFWQPNGYGLDKGEGYYQNIWVLFNQVSVGLSKSFSVGAGVVPLFFFGEAATPVWVTPKLSIPITKDKFNIGVGVLAGSLLGVRNYTYDYNTGVGRDTKTNENFGVAYGIFTFGSRDKNLSLGLGYGYSQGRWASSPSVSFSFLVRVSDKGYILSENYIINDVGLITVGGRRIIKKVSLDFGLICPVGAGNERLITIPWLGLVVPFNKKS